jgi:hypothetical protein
VYIVGLLRIGFSDSSPAVAVAVAQTRSLRFLGSRQSIFYLCAYRFGGILVLCCDMLCVMIHVPFTHFLDSVLLKLVQGLAQIFSEVPSSILENCS